MVYLLFSFQSLPFLRKRMTETISCVNEIANAILLFLTESNGGLFMMRSGVKL